MSVLSFIRSRGLGRFCVKYGRSDVVCKQSQSYHKAHNQFNRWKEKAVEVKIPLDQERKTHLKISSGNLARFADGSATAQLGETAVMVTAVSKDHGENAASNFLPLTVNYRQKAAAAGRIPTNHLRREIGTTDSEILTSRMIDRSLRPLFPKHFTSETQVMCNLLAVDGVNDPAVTSINAASAALSLSDIPWNGPVGAARVGLVGGQLIANPTRKQLATSKLDLVVVSTAANKIVMLEGSAERVPTEEFKEALLLGSESGQVIAEHIAKMSESQGVTKRPTQPPDALPQEVTDLLKDLSEVRITEELIDPSHHKFSRDNAIQEIKASVLTDICEKYPALVADQVKLSCLFDDFYKQVFRNLILETRKRCDGRCLTSLRPISCQVDMFSPLHGSALFQRGQTQVLCTLTFDSPESAAKLDSVSSLMSGIKEKNFFLHYEFPPYATNEMGRAGGFGRREVGHGALAERGLRPIVPTANPFSIRLNAEVLESNGSSSMASVCAGSLALMDAGVNVSEAAAGIAIGLISPEENSSDSDAVILTDLLGIEDYMGDMDFKISGTKTGITAIQADVKIPGLPMSIVHKAVEQGVTGIHDIIDIMNKTLDEPRLAPKSNRPVIEQLDVSPEQRSVLVGPGGLNIKRIMTETGVSLTQRDEKSFQMFAPNSMAMEEAKDIISQLLAENKEMDLEFGAIYQATIVEVRDYGVMVQLFKNQSPVLVHNSQLDHRNIKHASALQLSIGDEISVKYFGRDPSTGKIRLSRKVLQGRTSLMKNLFNKPT